MRLALFQPDIAGNVGTVLRLAACFGIAVDIIEPCGFPFSDRGLRRAGMDYAASAEISRHPDWRHFLSTRKGRIMLLTTKAEATLYQSQFQPDDILLFGSEGAGAPDFVHAEADESIRIPMQSGFRSLNIAVSAGIALSEALRQTGGFAS